MQVMALSRLGEPETRTVFYFAVGSAVAGAVGMAFTGLSPWHWQAAAWLVPIGLLAAVGQLSMTRAYARAGSQARCWWWPTCSIPACFSPRLQRRVVWRQNHAMGWAGMALIVASGIAATVLRARAAPDAPAEEH
jgi:S-adenosylmethionine uptake transporter